MGFYELINLIESSSIFSGFLSGLILLLIGSLLLPRYLSYLKRPKIVEFFDKESGSKEIPCKKICENKYTFTFEPILRNKKGSSLMSGVFWHLYFPSFCEVKAISLGIPTLPGFEKNIDNSVHFFGKIDHPVFENATFSLQYSFIVTFEIDRDVKNFPLLAWFSTEFGNYPRTLKNLNDYGLFDWRTMDKIKVIICK